MSFLDVRAIPKLIWPNSYFTSLFILIGNFKWFLTQLIHVMHTNKTFYTHLLSTPTTLIKIKTIYSFLLKKIIYSLHPPFIAKVPYVGGMGVFENETKTMNLVVNKDRARKLLTLSKK